MLLEEFEIHVQKQKINLHLTSYTKIDLKYFRE